MVTIIPDRIDAMLFEDYGLSVDSLEDASTASSSGGSDSEESFGSMDYEYTVERQIGRDPLKVFRRMYKFTRRNRASKQNKKC